MAKSKNKKESGSVKLDNPKWELFAHLYSGHHNMQLFGNGTRCYELAYGYEDRISKNLDAIADLREKAPAGYTVKVAALEAANKRMKTICSVEANRLLANPKISARANYLLNSKISHQFTDQELQYVIAQRNDLASKVQAIREYNKVHDRTKAGKLEGEFTFRWADEDDDN